MISRIVTSFVLAFFQPTLLLSAIEPPKVTAPASDESETSLARVIEARRIDAIDKVIGSVVAVYGLDRQGGGSGVIIDPSGIALTNHHVIAGAGVAGFGGLADGKLYPWKLIGTDPGGDVAVIQMSGKDVFPFTPLGDSDQVRTGDWALAMGNPFLLAEDQSPTVTLGIVSGVKRYQPGAGQNQLVYGNCIQVDSSINPGNSGGPLFSLAAEVIGINGRGSFQDRGRVNVGLGYAISANQIKNFLPELLATKLVEHATLDAGFSDRNGKVVCSQIDRESPLAKLGLSLNDELIEFEGTSITSANQFTNLICTLPEEWPAFLMVRKPDGSGRTYRVRAFGLPYPKAPRKAKPAPVPENPDPKDKPEEQPDPQQEERDRDLRQEMIKLLSAPPGTIRDAEVNQRYARLITDRWREQTQLIVPSESKWLKLECDLLQDEQVIGHQQVVLTPDGRFWIDWQREGQVSVFCFDGEQYRRDFAGIQESFTQVGAKLDLRFLQAFALSELVAGKNDIDKSKVSTRFRQLGELMLDGAGKAAGKLAWRFRAEDSEGDQTFLWFDVTSRRNGLQSKLRKISASKDCVAGAVRFDDWRPWEDGELPMRWSFVDSLAEDETLAVDVKSVEWWEGDAELFSIGEEATHE